MFGWLWTGVGIAAVRKIKSAAGIVLRVFGSFNVYLNLKKAATRQKSRRFDQDEISHLIRLLNRYKISDIGDYLRFSFILGREITMNVSLALKLSVNQRYGIWSEDSARKMSNRQVRGIFSFLVYRPNPEMKSPIV
jgi:hypothetical protein